MKTTITLLLLITSNYSIGQNIALQKSIDSLLTEDHKYRVLDRKSDILQKNIAGLSAKSLSQQSQLITNSNLNSVKTIFQKRGFLNYDKVGKIHSDRFVYLLEYCSSDPQFQLEVLESMKVEIERNNASPLLYAVLLDRVLVNLKRPQVYGTQVNLNYNETTYEPIKPIVEIEKLDERRKTVGLPPMAESIAELNRKFKGQ
jgi:hypothetical protein